MPERGKTQPAMVPEIEEAADDEEYKSGLSQEHYEQLGQEQYSRTYGTQTDYEQLGADGFSAEKALEPEDKAEAEGSPEKKYGDEELITDGGFDYEDESQIPLQNPEDEDQTP